MDFEEFGKIANLKRFKIYFKGKILITIRDFDDTLHKQLIEKLFFHFFEGCQYIMV